MELTLGKVLCGDELSDLTVLFESIRRLRDFCWDIVAKIRTNSADVEDAIRGIAFSYELDRLIEYYDAKGLEGLDEASIFLAKEASSIAMAMSLDFVIGTGNTSHE